MLSEMIVSHEDGLVESPEHLSFEEAATLPCAGVTAWNALFKHGGLAEDDFVLLEGTGGVSIFGLQFSVATEAIAQEVFAKLREPRPIADLVDEVPCSVFTLYRIAAELYESDQIG
jgi:NADPH:quinone reductase-like Zn-dependent oxidoreductase